MEKHQHEFLCIACPGIDKFPSFATFKQVCEHSSEVHEVRLESAVQSSTLLPEKLDMYLCRLCTPQTRDIFQCKTLVKQHLETHSTFFLKKWEEFIEIQCRICEDVIDIEDLEHHVNEFHPRNLFADVKEAIVNSNPNSQANQDLHLSQLSSSPVESKSHSLPCTTSFSVESEEVQSWQSSQPASEKNLLWDHCFQPEQLINKYFSSLAPAKTAKDVSTTPATVQADKPLIRLKPLSLLLAQSQQVETSPMSPSSETNIPSPPRSEPPIRAVKISTNREIKEEKTNENFHGTYVKQSTSLDDVSQIECTGKKYLSLSDTQSSHRPISPAPSVLDKSSPVRELPPYSGWLSSRPKHSQDLQRSSYSRNSVNNVAKDDCVVCGMQVVRLHSHISSEHQDMLFRCKLGGCRTRKVGYLYPNQLDRHHAEYHNLSRISWGWLDTSREVIGLPASLVKIICPINKCSHFVLSTNSSLMDKHLWSVHHLENTTLRYLCRVCSTSFPSLEDVVEHSGDHMGDGSQSKTDMDKREHEFGTISYSSNRGGRSRSLLSSSRQSSEQRSWSPINKRKRSPSRKSWRSPSRKSRRSLSRKSKRSPSWKSRRSPSRKSRRSPSRMSRRSPSKKSRRSPSRMSRRSPSRKSRRSPTKKSRRSPSRESRRSSSRKSRRSPSRKSKRSPSRNRRKSLSKSLSRKSRTSPCVKSRVNARSSGRKRIISPSRSSSRKRSCSRQSRRSPSRKKMRFQDGDQKRSPDSRKSSSRQSRILSVGGPSSGYNLISGGPERSRCGRGSPGSSTQFYSYHPSGNFSEHK